MQGLGAEPGVLLGHVKRLSLEVDRPRTPSSPVLLDRCETDAPPCDNQTSLSQFRILELSGSQASLNQVLT